MTITTELSLTQLIDTCSQRLSTVFSHYLDNIASPDLESAMKYTLSNGGKRIRPLLIYATGQIFNAPLENLDIPASSVELIHTYSLIHDDLPAMDNADLRRGKATCHKAYDEGIAILAGDALHTLAMQMMASHPALLKAERRLQMMSVLSKACGPYGMAAGQALDITVMNDTSLSAEDRKSVYHIKTGCLLSACIELGRLAGEDDNDINQAALKRFGDIIGFAFQIQDDILDIETCTEALGKRQGTDQVNHKITYPKMHGLNHAKAKVSSLYEQALEEINYLGQRAQLLRALIGHMLYRNN